jgi:hypothetical protein
MKKLYTVIGTIGLGVLLAGCASPMGPNQAGGTMVGGTTGALLGGIIGHASHNTAGGALIGGAIGALTGALVGKDIDETTRMHVTQGQPLTIEDIKALTKAGVGDDLIISQINSTRTVYKLNTAQIIDLKNSGVNQKVIDYMINTQSMAAQTQEPAVYSGGYYYVAPYPYYYYPYPFVYGYYGPRWHGGAYWHGGGGFHGHHR